MHRLDVRQSLFPSETGKFSERATALGPVGQGTLSGQIIDGRRKRLGGEELAR